MTRREWLCSTIELVCHGVMLPYRDMLPSSPSVTTHHTLLVLETRGSERLACGGGSSRDMKSGTLPIDNGGVAQ